MLIPQTTGVYIPNMYFDIIIFKHEMNYLDLTDLLYKYTQVAMFDKFFDYIILFTDLLATST